jgi:hypothetical protein
LEIFEKKLLPIVIKLSKDRVSNVRMNAASIFRALAGINLSKDSLKEVNAAVEELKKDKDSDVINVLD